MIQNTLPPSPPPTLNNILLTRPDAGQAVTVAVPTASRLEFAFDQAEGDISRDGENLVLSFGDGATLTLEGFYDAFSPDMTPPLIVVQGRELPGEDFLAALGDPDLMPLAGLVQQFGGGLYSDALLAGVGGVNRLNKLLFDADAPDPAEEPEVVEGVSEVAAAASGIAGLAAAPLPAGPGGGYEPPAPPAPPVVPPVVPPVEPPVKPPVEPPALSVRIVADNCEVHEAALSPYGSGRDWSGGSSGQAALHDAAHIARGNIFITGDLGGHAVSVTFDGMDIWAAGMGNLAKGQDMTFACSCGSMLVSNLGSGRYAYEYTLTEAAAHHDAQGNPVNEWNREDVVLAFNAGIHDAGGALVAAAQSSIAIIDDNIALENIATHSSFSSDSVYFASKMTVGFQDWIDSTPHLHYQEFGRNMLKDGVSISTGRVYNPNGDWTLDTANGGSLTLRNGKGYLDDRGGLGILGDSCGDRVFEIGYHRAENTSEALILDLGGKIANAVSFDFRSFYVEGGPNGVGGKPELMAAAFYLQGELVSMKYLDGKGTWNTYNGGHVFGKHESHDTGSFDRVVLFPRNNNNWTYYKQWDESDFYLRDAVFDFNETLLQYHAGGSFTADPVGADRLVPGSLAFAAGTSLPQELEAAGYTLSSGGAWIKVHDANGALAFDVRLNPDGAWDFDQYRPLPDNFSGKLAFAVTGSDTDGDRFEAGFSTVYRTMDGTIHGGVHADAITADPTGGTVLGGDGDDLILLPDAEAGASWNLHGGDNGLPVHGGADGKAHLGDILGLGGVHDFRSVIAEDANSIEGFESLLVQLDAGRTLDDLLAGVSELRAKGGTGAAACDVHSLIVMGSDDLLDNLKNSAQMNSQTPERDVQIANVGASFDHYTITDHDSQELHLYIQTTLA